MDLILNVLLVFKVIFLATNLSIKSTNKSKFIYIYMYCMHWTEYYSLNAYGQLSDPVFNSEPKLYEEPKLSVERS